MNSEYQEKIAIKNRLTDYYREQSIKNGLSGIEKIVAYTPWNFSLEPCGEVL